MAAAAILNLLVSPIMVTSSISSSDCLHFCKIALNFCAKTKTAADGILDFIFVQYYGISAPPWSATLPWWWGLAPMTRKISKIWRRGATKS